MANFPKMVARLMYTSLADKDPEGIIKAIPKTESEARNPITIENDEMGWGLESRLELENIVHWF